MPNVRTAVLLAAGRGTRLAPLTDTTPKPMLRVAGRPILEHTFTALPDSVLDVIIVVGYKREQIENHFGANWGTRRITYVEQTTLDGTAGAVHTCREYVHGPFLVLNGDDLYDRHDLEALARHQYGMLAKYVGDASRFGTLNVREDGTLIGIREGGDAATGSALVNTGAYMLDKRFFSVEPRRIMGKTEFGLPQTLATMTTIVPIAVVQASFWFPIGFPKDIAAANQLLTERT